jgi:hypothetical protein
LDGGIRFARSPIGFTNRRLGLKYLHYFHKYCPPSRPGAYRVLIFDGHGSHLSNEFLNFCWEHRIRPFLLPAHTTHLLQPLDIVVFRALKHWFQKELRREIFNGAEEFNKVDFFAIFQRFWDKVFKSRRMAVSSFEKTGLIPLNVIRVLEKMKEYQELQKRPRTPTPPPRYSLPILPSSPLAFATPPPRTPPQEDWRNWSIPLTLRTRKRGADYVKERTR